MRKPTLLLVYFLGAYVILQFIWWGFHLIELTKNSDKPDLLVQKRVWMILGEGSVFLLILLFGIFKIKKSIQKEINLARRQQNFMLSITHELKTPIASVRLFIQTLKRKDLDENKRTELLDKTLEENKRLELLVEKILTSAQLEQNSFAPNLERLDILVLLNQLKNEHFTKHKQEINITCSSFEFVTDKIMFIMLIQNLLENSVKYADASNVIDINVTCEPAFLHLTFSDFGPGIALEEQLHVFEAFYRIGNEETRKSKGTGLGLFIVKKIIKSLNGSIRIDSAYKHGLRFEITLPNGQ